MRSAKTVISNMARTITPPMAPRGLRRANRWRERKVRPIAGPRRSSAAGLAPAIGGETVPTTRLMSVADPRIQDGVEGVDGQVDEDDGRDHHQVDPLDDGVVPLVD